MKKVLSMFVTVMLTLAVLCAPLAVAEGNVNIAVRGLNGFNGHISGAQVWKGQLLFLSSGNLCSWSPETRELSEILSSDVFANMLDAIIVPGENGKTTLTLGNVSIEIGEDESFSLGNQLFVVGDRLYRRCFIFGNESVSNALFVEIKIPEDDAPEFGELIDMRDTPLQNYTSDLQRPCEAGGKLYALSYGNSGLDLLALDFESRSAEVLSIDMAGDLFSISPYADGKLLIASVDSDSEETMTKLYAYEVESNALTHLGDLHHKNNQPPNAILCDASRGKILYTLSGSVWRADVAEDALGESEEFGDMPLDVYNGTAALLLNQWYILAGDESIVARDVELGKSPEKTLRIAGTGYLRPIRDAYFSFTSEHSAYSVSITGGAAANDILRDMINRSSDVDIYSVDVASSAYKALLKRGFMAEIGTSEALKSAVEGMYPAIQDVVTKDGKLYALPVSASANTIMLNRKLLTGKLGYSEAGIPTNWVELFNLIAELSQGKREDMPEVNLLDPVYTRSETKQQVFSNMLDAYSLWLDSDEANLFRAGEVLRMLCEAFDRINWEGLGLPEEIADGTIIEYDEESILLMSGSVGFADSHGEALQPLTLSIVAGEKPLIGLRQTVAFVNPFSKHQEVAIQYLEKVYELVSLETKMSMSPEMNDPVRSPYYEENLKYYEQTISDLKESLDKNGEDANSTVISESIAGLEYARKQYVEKWSWDISAKGIAKYREMGRHFVAVRSDVYESVPIDAISQYLDGAIDANRLVKSLERTLLMKKWRICSRPLPIPDSPT